MHKYIFMYFCVYECMYVYEKIHDFMYCLKANYGNQYTLSNIFHHILHKNKDSLL